MGGNPDGWQPYDITKINCPRCRNTLGKLQNIIVSLPVIQRNEIRGICNHCFAKLQYDLACEHCKEIKDIFAITKGISYKEQPSERVRTQSEIELYGLLLEEALPMPRHDINIESLFHSGTKLYLDIFEKKTPQVVPKIEVQDEEIIQASVIEVEKKVEEEDLGPVNVRFAEEPVVVKSDESSLFEDFEVSVDVESKDFSLNMAKVKMERARRKELLTERRNAICGAGILKLYKDTRQYMETKKHTTPPQEEISRKAVIFKSFQKAMPVKKTETDAFVEKRFQEILRKLEEKRGKKFSARIKKRKTTKSQSSVRFVKKTKIISRTESTELLTRKRKRRPRSAISVTKSILKHGSQEIYSPKLRALSIFKKYVDKIEAPSLVQLKKHPIISKKKEKQALKVYKEILEKEYTEKEEETKKEEKIKKKKKTTEAESKIVIDWKSFKIKSVNGEKKLAKEQTLKFVSAKDVERKKKNILLKKTSKDIMDEHADVEEKLTKKKHRKLEIPIKAKRIKPTKLKKKIITKAMERKRRQKKGKEKKELQTLEEESLFKFDEKIDLKLHKVTSKSLSGIKWGTHTQESQITVKKEKMAELSSHVLFLEEPKETVSIADEEDILKKVMIKSKSAAIQGKREKLLEIKKDVIKGKLVYRDYDPKQKEFKAKVISDPNLVARKKPFEIKKGREVLKKGDAYYEEKLKLKEKPTVGQDEGKKLLKIKKDKTKTLDHDDGLQKVMLPKGKSAVSKDDRKKSGRTKKSETKEKDFDMDIVESLEKTSKRIEEDKKDEMKTTASKTDTTEGSSLKDKQLKRRVHKKQEAKTYETDSNEILLEKTVKTDITEELHEVSGEAEDYESRFQVQEQFIQDYRLIDAKKIAAEAKKTKMAVQPASDNISVSEEKSIKPVIEEKKVKMVIEFVPESIDAPDEKDVITAKSSKESILASVSTENKEKIKSDLKKKTHLPSVQKKQKKKKASQQMLQRTPSPLAVMKPVIEKKSPPTLKEKRLRRTDDPKKVKSLLKKQQDVLDMLLGNDKYRKKKVADEMRQDKFKKLESINKHDKGLFYLLRRKEKKTRPERETRAVAVEVIPTKHDKGTQIQTRDPRLTEIEKLLLKGKPKPRRRQRATTPFELEITELTKTESLPSVEIETSEGKTKSKTAGSQIEKLPEIIVGNKIYKSSQAPHIEEKKGLKPILFKTSYEGTEKVGETMTSSSEVVTSYSEESIKVEKPKLLRKGVKGTGVIRYQLSDPTFIDKGWTVLPTDKVVRKVPIYRMHLAGTDWFEQNMEKDEIMYYCTDEVLAKYYSNGCGRWYYKNGKVALDSYKSKGIGAKRIVLFSDGEPDERGRTYPITVLAIFDYNGNGIVFDHTGNIRLKYNQMEGVVLDPEISPLTHWKWHDLKQLPEDLFSIPVESKLSHEDIHLQGFKPFLEYELNDKREQDNTMLKIEFDNYVRQQISRKKIIFKKQYKYHDIRMKYFKINKYFSLKILEQRKIRLHFNCDSNILKFELGMILDQKEVIDTEFVDAGSVVFNCMEQYPAKTESILYLQRLRENSMREEQARRRPPQEWRSTATTARDRRAHLELLQSLQRSRPEISDDTTAAPATTSAKKYRK